MIHDVVKFWIANLNGLEQSGILTKVYGLVRPGLVRVQSDRDYVMPILFDEPDRLACDSYEDGLLINDTQRAIVFVEGDTARPIPGPGSAVLYGLPVRVVVWFNRTGYSNVNPPGPLLASAVINELKKKPVVPAGAGLQLSGFTQGDIVEGWRALRAYTFREETGFLQAPYESFSIEGTLKFILNENDHCKDALLLTPIVGTC